MDNPRRVHLRILLATAIVSLVASAATAQVTETILHRFANGTDGAQPWAALIQATDGNFYGTTVYGGGSTNCNTVGPGGCGTVFKMTPDGTVTVLHAFVGGTDGAYPEAPLIQAADGNFYGTTSQGGGVTNCEGGVQRIDCGTVFQMTPDGIVTVLHAFAGTDGGNPGAALLQANDGNFYGTTNTCASGSGTIFQMTPDGTVTVLHVFNDGQNYYPALIQATDGNFYGTNVGAVFQMTPDGTFTVLHVFAGGTDGGQTYASLIQATDGNFYGTTYYGGVPFNGGTVFQMTSDGTATVRHAFAGGTEGHWPYAAVIQATDGNFYGMAQGGAGCDSGTCGTVFQMIPDGTVTPLYAFAGPPDGAFPYYQALIQATDGNFYGTTVGGGSGGGVVFELTLGLAPTATRPRTR
jgi:uncharacterized repeat protein (TIGR03803 family)